MSTTQTTMATNEDKDKDKMTQEEKTKYFIGGLLLLLVIGLIVYFVFYHEDKNAITSSTSPMAPLTNTPTQAQLPFNGPPPPGYQGK